MSNRVLRLPEVKKITGLSRSTIYLKMSKEEFPRSISLGERAIGWLEKDIEVWLSQCVERSRDAG